MSSEELTWIKEKYSTKNCPVLFDVGAHNFHDSIAMKQLIYHAAVYAFEPDLNNLAKYKQLADSYKINVIDNAVSDKTGVLTFYTANNEASGSLIYPSVKNNFGESKTHENLVFNLQGTTVKTITLEEFCKGQNIQTIDHMHLDVQGAEYSVIKGLGNLRPKSIFAETCEFKTYKTNLTLEDFDDLMTDKDYKIIKRFQYDTLYEFTA